MDWKGGIRKMNPTVRPREHNCSDTVVDSTGLPWKRAVSTMLPFKCTLCLVTSRGSAELYNPIPGVSWGSWIAGDMNAPNRFEYHWPLMAGTPTNKLPWSTTYSAHYSLEEYFSVWFLTLHWPSPQVDTSFAPPPLLNKRCTTQSGTFVSRYEVVIQIMRGNIGLLRLRFKPISNMGGAADWMFFFNTFRQNDDQQSLWYCGRR